MTELKLSGKSDAKGRNGYFKLDTVNVWELQAVNEEQPIQVEFYSKRTGGAPPIRLQLTYQDAAALAAFLHEALRTVEATK